MGDLSREELKFKLSALQQQSDEKEDRLKNEISKLKQEIDDLNSYYRSINKGINIFADDIQVKKKVLELYSKGKNVGTIKDNLTSLGIENISEQFIYDICYNIDTIEPELKTYYLECSKEYEKQLKINPDLLNDRSIQILQEMIDSSIMDLRRTNDLALKMKIRDSMNKHIDSMNKLSNNIDMSEKLEASNNDVNEIKNRMKNRNKKILEGLNLENFKVVK